ncbi:SusD/RagB family nutrient-binding outer membrane lipoprotein [Tenacibaculum maritimum]|uniref:SusD/RagB family nutrient-binding outer membrane lipoprotein n=1 Tax=Tenacibaculum maritimum TaxID=107401 RepID=UPI0012E6C9D3|nr:SusD/RagB family nutrient-binding outer membrane lipoprotein [Tenacibaculum maritimum]CAA0153447.1 SusD/RagB family lipoprotein precursor [Tenacibaculum maritimum]CAA0216939.1 SusD/RagB family lipoprotein precursor [Tenacibaculum maritimum]CAA0240886.1 SusD/RagB family lipoprotein precursor [Tenacibaculum maritimum]
MKKQIIKFIVLFAFSIASISCSDFLDVNEDPNNPTTSTPKLTLPVIQRDLLALNARSMNYMGNFMVYNWSTPSNWSSNQNLIRYNITTNTFSNIWETSYADIFKNITYIENFKKGTVDYTAYKIISKTLKGFQYQYLVDLYGDIPYTEANLRADNLTPAYDKAETIYKDLIAKLTEAATLATNLPANYENPGSQDIIFSGDMQKWAQFANTIKLRLLIRMSKTGQDSYITSEIAKIDANGAGYITTNVIGNPGYSDNENRQNPFFGYQGKAPNQNTPNDRNDFTTATDYAINFLGTTTNDPRMERLYSKADNGGYHGAEQSTALPSKGFTSKDLSHVGPGLLIDSKQDQPLMLYAEALLLQAEAMVRGYISGGDAAAKAKYEEAITSSFEFLKVPDATISSQTYYNQAIPNVSWDNSANKLQAIAIQKWVALNGVSGVESWIEVTRTGYPSNLPTPTEANSGGKRPVRLLYPESEVSRNPLNVPAQTKDAVFTNIPFWNK